MPDWLCRKKNLLQPQRKTTKIYHLGSEPHQYGIIFFMSRSNGLVTRSDFFMSRSNGLVTRSEFFMSRSNGLVTRSECSTTRSNG